MKRWVLQVIYIGLFIFPQAGFSGCDDSHNSLIEQQPTVKEILAPFWMTTASSCTTTNKKERDEDEKERLKHYIHENYYYIAEDVASGCGEDVDALYSLYIEALYVGEDDETLTNEFFCQVLRKDFDIIFKDFEYNDDFLPILEHRIDLASDGL